MLKTLNRAWNDVCEPGGCLPAAADVVTQNDLRASTTHGAVRLVAVLVVAIQRLGEVLLQRGAERVSSRWDVRGRWMEVRHSQNGLRWSKAGHIHQGERERGRQVRALPCILHKDHLRTTGGERESRMIRKTSKSLKSTTTVQVQIKRVQTDVLSRRTTLTLDCLALLFHLRQDWLCKTPKFGK